MEKKARALETSAQITEAWQRFRAGDPVLCAHEGAALALAVEGASKSYRFVCTECGAASPWFEPKGNELRVLVVRDESDFELPQD